MAHIYATYDKYAEMYFGLMTFDNHDLAYASIRRMIRDLYHRNEITYDELCDTKFVHVADFDEKTGLISAIDPDCFAFVNANEFVDGDTCES